jgi:tetratricopeptide (TPR) repeat protein
MEPTSATLASALAFRRAGDLGQAEEVYNQILQADPLQVEALQGLAGIAYQLGRYDQGRFDEARTHFLKALALQPDFAPATFFLARDGRQPFTDADVARIEQLLRRDSLPPRDRINLHFALGRLHDRAKAFDEAFHHCDQGNTAKKEVLRLQGNTFQSAAHAQFIDRLIASFDPEFFRRVCSFGSDSELPVFIVGMPRSGTSLVEQILASHPAVFGAGELRNMKRFVAELPAELSSPAEFPECLDRLDQETSRRLAERYLERLRLLGGEKLRVTDKLPMNFHQLGLIAALFPRAQIIHCRRDARDVCWSCYFQNFRDIHFACDLKALGAYHRQYERLMTHWREVLPVPVLEVCYEELVENPERGSREIVAFCQLPWHEECLTFYRTPRSVRTASNMQVRQPVYKRSVGYWKNYEAHLGPLFEALAGAPGAYSPARPAPLEAASRAGEARPGPAEAGPRAAAAGVTAVTAVTVGV